MCNRVDGILEGTTIARVMNLVRDHHLLDITGDGEEGLFLSEALFKDLDLKDLLSAKEVVAGGASMIYPITSIDGRLVGDGQPGQVSDSNMAIILPYLLKKKETLHF